MESLSIIKSKIITIEEYDNIKHQISYWNFKGKKIVFTNGCFDIIHRGHIEYLSRAADFGDILVIGLNNDPSVRKLKGENRPVNDEFARALLLASLKFVDLVVLFKEDTPYNLISRIQPDILVKGGDYTIDNIVGADIVTHKGGDVFTIDFIEGYSTTSIINKSK